MKTLRELLAEIRSVHDSYAKWGLMSSDGTLIHGIDHPDARTHWDVDEGKSKIAWAQEGPPKDGHADSSWGLYRDGLHSGHKLNIRTQDKDALATAIKHFDRFPHVRGRQVDWDHTPTIRNDSDKIQLASHLGNAEGIHNKMKAHYRKHYGPLPA